MSNELFPKVIWFSWLQGKSEMPLLTKYCLLSWEKMNPDWKIQFLTLDNYREFVELEFISQDNHVRKNLTIFSDILRFNLLNKYGGVWVDSTTFCTKALDAWLYGFLNDGFFAFSRPKRKVAVSVWFIASMPNNYIIRRWCETVNSYWCNNPYMDLCNKSSLRLFLIRILSVFLEFITQSRSFWFHPFISKTLSVRPYHVHEYIFENLYRKDKKFKETYDSSSCGKLVALLGTFLQLHGINKSLSSKTKSFLDLEKSPIHKLNYRIKLDINKDDSVFSYLLNKSSISKNDL